MQAALAGGVIVVGLQLTEDSVGAAGGGAGLFCAMLMVLPDAVMLTDWGVELVSVPDTPAKVSWDEVAAVLDEIWNVMPASTPSAIAVLLNPTTRQRMSPGET